MTRLDDTRFWHSSPLSFEYAGIELVADALCVTCLLTSGRLRKGCTVEVVLGDCAGLGVIRGVGWPVCVGWSVCVGNDVAESCDGR